MVQTTIVAIEQCGPFDEKLGTICDINDVSYTSPLLRNLTFGRSFEPTIYSVYTLEDGRDHAPYTIP